MFRLLKTLPLTLALAVLSFFTTSCTSSNTQARFVNAIADTPDYGGNLDIEVNGTKEFSSVAFSSVEPTSGYASIPSGNVTIKGFQPGNTTTPVFSFPVNTGLSAGSQYTLVATGTDTGNNGSNVFVMAVADNNTAPANASVNFRLINASPSTPVNGVDVYFIPCSGQNICSQPPTNGCSAANDCISGITYRNTPALLTLSYNSLGFGWQMFVTPSGNPTQFILFQNIGNFGSATEGAICTFVLKDETPGGTMSQSPVVLQDLNAAGCTATP
jgi:hypothetical protein